MQKIKLSIADRVYPLSVPEGEEAILREAAKSLNVMVDHFEKNYAVKDKQDVLAMCALQFASRVEQSSIDTKNISIEAESKLREMNSFLDQILD